MTYLRDLKIVMIVYFVFYFCVLVHFGLSNQLLSQYNPISFSHNHDIAELLVISTGLPATMISKPFLFLLIDVCMIIVPCCLICYFLVRRKFFILIGILFSFTITLYLLLQDILTQSHAESFMGILILSFCFLSNRQNIFYYVLSMGRYFIIYVFVSAAAWKILRGTYLNREHFSDILISQHANILNGGHCSEVLCRLYQYLIDHPALSFTIYILAILMELTFIIGLFTKRADKLLLILAIVFFAADHLFMRITYWPFMVLGITFLLGNNNRTESVKTI